MAIKPHFNLPDIPQHVIQRSNNHQPCFFSNLDRQRYLDLLHEASIKNNTAIHAYVLMSNHVHLLLTPGNEYSVTHTLQDLGCMYMRYFNDSYERSGTLWEERYKASLIDCDSYLISCMRFIEMNPVRASIVNHAREFHWSSFCCNALGRHNKLLKHHTVYTALGINMVNRIYAYKALCNQSLDDEIITNIRTSLNQELVLGSPEFKHRIELMMQQPSRIVSPDQARDLEPTM